MACFVLCFGFILIQLVGWSIVGISRFRMNSSRKGCLSSESRCLSLCNTCLDCVEKFKINSLNSASDGLNISLRHDHVTYSSLLGVKTILVNQHKFFNMFCSYSLLPRKILGCFVPTHMQSRKIPRMLSNIELLQVKHA